MFTVRFQVRDFVERTPIDDAAVAVSLEVFHGSPFVTPPAKIRPHPGRNVGGGIYECSFDLAGAYSLAYQLSATRPIDAIWGTAHVVVGGHDDSTSWDEPLAVNPDLTDLDALVIPATIHVDFAKAIVGDTTEKSVRLWFAWNGRGPMPDGHCVCEIENLGPPGRGPPPFEEPRPGKRWAVPVNFSEEPRVSNTAALLIGDLLPGTKYRFALRFSAVGAAGIAGLGRALATGTFTTAPVASTGLSFVFGSCHLPGPPENLGRWNALAGRSDYDLMLLIGDQIYEDKIEAMGLTWAERYWNRYHQYWTCWPMREVLRRTPTYMMLDDHEVKDDWGAGKQDFKLCDGQEHAALSAYEAFQQAHNPGGVRTGLYHYGFQRGPAAFFVLDVRSQRSDPAYPVLGEAQFNDFRDWANGPARAADIVFVVATVPIAYLPAMEIGRLLDEFKDAWSDLGTLVGGILGKVPGALIAHYGARYAVETELRQAGVANLDLDEMWTQERNQPDLRRVLETLFDLANDVQDGQPGPRPRAVVVLGGDVHCGAIHRIVSRLPRHAGNNSILQLISSPISQEPVGYMEPNDMLLHYLVSHIQPGVDISPWLVAQAGKDYLGLVKMLYGEAPATFPLDDKGEKVFWSHFEESLGEQNFGRVAVQRLSAERPVYRLSVNIAGETDGLSRTLEFDLSNLGGEPLPDPGGPPAAAVFDGDVIMAPNRPEIFLIESGQRRWIPDVVTFLLETGAQVKTLPLEIIISIPQGADLLVPPDRNPPKPHDPDIVLPGSAQCSEAPPPAQVAEGDLIQRPDDPAVFIVSDGVRRWVPDVATFQSRWRWDQVRMVPQDAMDAVPRGADLPSALAPPTAAVEGALIRGAYASRVFLVEGGMRRQIPDVETLLSRWTWDQVATVPDEMLAMTPRGPDLPSVAAAPAAPA